MNNLRDVLAHNIKKYRKASKMTQKDLADLVGVSISAVSNWEKGNNTLTIDCLFNVCNALDISLSQITNADDFEFSKVEREMISKFRNASPLEQIQVLNLLDVQTIPAKLLPYVKLMKELNEKPTQKDN